ncbi:MAG: bifunctional riboflavin kinase/FAD synthetase [Rhodospirillales bacterium]|nr:bifunctional riboflavin kinase/FAD synthetase [Rhodospirillales bacterium]
MQVFRDWTDLPAAARGAVLAIGNFDGVHLGHCAVIEEAARRAAELGAPHAVLTFEPHPRKVFRPDLPPFRLTPFPAKARLIEALGVEILFALRFDLEFARKTPEAFAREVLAEGLGARHVLAGYNFVFGHGRAGTPARLVELGRAMGFGVTIVPPVTRADGQVISATAVREHLQRGAPRAAASLLGRPWEIEGPVEEGDRRGRAIGFPTANVALGEHFRPATGVYAVEVEGLGPGVANFGHRPTVGGSDLRFEVHLLDFSGDLYGKTLRVALIEYLRGERKFDSLASLKAQIAEDARQAREALAQR